MSLTMVSSEFAAATKKGLMFRAKREKGERGDRWLGGCENWGDSGSYLEEAAWMQPPLD
jgi:hypothetical protein